MLFIACSPGLLASLHWPDYARLNVLRILQANDGDACGLQFNSVLDDDPTLLNEEPGEASLAHMDPLLRSSGPGELSEETVTKYYKLPSAARLFRGSFLQKEFGMKKGVTYCASTHAPVWSTCHTRRLYYASGKSTWRDVGWYKIGTLTMGLGLGEHTMTPC